MAELAGITQSISRAWRLLNQTGLFDMARGMHTEVWQNHVHHALEELRKADRSLRSHSRGFTGSVLARMRSAILAAAPTRETAVEQAASRQGDPMPIGITPQEGFLAQCNNDGAAANRLGHRLQDIKRRMNAWLEWLQRHHKHPSYVPPWGIIYAQPTASADSINLIRTGSYNCSGPVQGAVRGAANHGPTGFA